MADKARAAWSRFRPITILLGLLLVGLAVGVSASFALRTAHPELSKALAQGAVTLFFGALLGGIASQLFAAFDRRRLQRELQLTFFDNVLKDLKAVYDAVDGGRTLLKAKASAKAYGEEMRKIVEARVKLRNVERALKFDERGNPIGTVLDHVEPMMQYLDRVIGEFETKFPAMSEPQGSDAAGSEAAPKPAAATSVEDHSPARRPAFQGLEVCDDVEYRRRFVDPLDDASREIREALRAELGLRSTRAS
jgi:hypothetical protein